MNQQNNEEWVREKLVLDSRLNCAVVPDIISYSNLQTHKASNLNSKST
jgi:hypothetical protein